MTIEEQAINRKFYVEQVRSSFPDYMVNTNKNQAKYKTEAVVNTGYLKNKPDSGGETLKSYGKTHIGIRLLISCMLFAAYFISAFTGMKLYSFTSGEIENKVRENFQYEELLGVVSEKIPSIGILLEQFDLY